MEIFLFLFLFINIIISTNLLDEIIHVVGEVCLVAGWCLRVYCLCHGAVSRRGTSSEEIYHCHDELQTTAQSWLALRRQESHWLDPSSDNDPDLTALTSELSSPQCVRGISPSCNLLENKQSSSSVLQWDYSGKMSPWQTRRSYIANF